MNAPRLLLLRTDRLGDTVLALPAAAELRAAFPNAHIGFVCRPENEPLVALDRNINEVIAWAPEQGAAALRERIGSWDGCAMLLPKPPSVAWALMLEGIPIRVGTARRWWALLYTHRVGGSRRSGQAHESEHNRLLAHELIRAFKGSPVDTLPAPTGITIPDTLAQRAAAIYAESGLHDAPTVILHGGSRGSARDWSMPRMLGLAQILLDEGYQVAWTVGPVDEAIRADVELALGDEARFISGCSLDELCAVCARAACLVANSTGPLHVAAAVGTPVVGLYPPVQACTPDRWGPIGTKQIIITAPLREGESNPLPDPESAPPDLMDRITVAEVHHAVTSLITGIAS
ncbi:MAG: glycosyltransferase family 9 protein [Planctomycetota bacterium]|jgi:heptosyltransferase-3|nr:glycosyltransferase family 9 protein [Planctomycetota bacterium]